MNEGSLGERVSGEHRFWTYQFPRQAVLRVGNEKYQFESCIQSGI